MQDIPICLEYDHAGSNKNHHTQSENQLLALVENSFDLPEDEQTSYCKQLGTLYKHSMKLIPCNTSASDKVALKHLLHFAWSMLQLCVSLCKDFSKWPLSWEVIGHTKSTWYTSCLCLSQWSTIYWWTIQSTCMCSFFIVWLQKTFCCLLFPLCL